MIESKKYPVYRNRVLILLFLTTFGTSLAMSSINAIWPLYIMSLGATVFEASYVISLSGIAGTILRGPSGMISDKLGRRRVVLASIVLAIIPPLSYTFATSWSQLIPWATIYGLAFALFMPTTIAWIADLVPQKERTAAYSFLNMAFPLGFMAGPTLGGIVVDVSGWTDLFILVAAIHGLSLLPTVMIAGTEKKTIDARNPPQDVSSQRGQTKILLLLLFLQFLFGFGFGTVNPVIPIYLTERFDSTATQIGIFSSIGFGVAVFLAQIPSTRLAERVGKESLILYCSSIIPFTFILWSSGTMYAQLLVLYMLATGAWGMTWSSLASILMEAAPRSRRGLFSGLSEAGVSLGFTAGAALAGMLWESLGPETPLYVSSLIFAVAIPVALMLRSSK
jgi:MFS family permease